MSDTLIVAMNAIETTGVVDAQKHLRLDQPLPIPQNSRVRVIILVPDSEEISESEWLTSTASNPAFGFLKDSAEDIYSLSDGKPFHDEG